MDQATHVRTCFVKAVWDDDAKVWYVSNTDVPGLAVEADNPEELVKLLNTLIPELMELNDRDGGSVPYSLMLDHLTAGHTVA